MKKMSVLALILALAFSSFAGKRYWVSDGTGADTIKTSLSSVPGYSIDATQYKMIRDTFYIFGADNTTNIYRCPKNSPYNLSVCGTMPASIGWAQIVTVRDTMYLIGGYDGADLNTIYRATIADPTTWSLVAGKTIPFGLNQYCSVVDSQYVYLVGGENNSTACGPVLRCPIDTLFSWTVFDSVAPYKDMRNLASILINDTLWLFGVEGFYNYTIDTVMNNIVWAEKGADLTLKSSWHVEEGKLPKSTAGGNLLVDDNYMYIFGGWGIPKSGEYVGSLSKYVLRTPISDKINGWEVVDSLPYVNSFAPGYTTNGGVFLFGGWTGVLTNGATSLFYNFSPDSTRPAYFWGFDSLADSLHCYTETENVLGLGGGAYYSAADKKYGDRSLYLANSGSYCWTSDVRSADLGGHDWTMEMWIKGSWTSNRVVTYDGGGGNWGNNGWGYVLDVISNTVDMYYTVAGNTYAHVASGALSTSGWHHVALTSHDDSMRIFFDGTKVATGYCGDMISVTGANMKLYLGHTANAFAGYIDEFRLWNDTALYLTDFTPEASKNQYKTRYIDSIPAANLSYSASQNWSTVSGGIGGAGAPASGDTLFLDGHSAYTCAVDTNYSIKDIRLSGGLFSLPGRTMTISGNVTVSDSGHFAFDGTSRFVFPNTPTISMGGDSMPTCTLGNGAHFTTSAKISRMKMNAAGGDTALSNAGTKLYFGTVTNDDWNGSAGSLNYFLSASPGTVDTVSIPGNRSMSYLRAGDQYTPTYSLTTANGYDAGNNTGWVWDTFKINSISPETLTTSGGACTLSVSNGRTSGGSLTGGTLVSQGATEWAFTAPAHAVGAVDIIGQSGLGVSGLDTIQLQYATGYTPPSLVSLSMNAASRNGGASISYYGTGFNSNCVAYMGSNACTDQSVSGDTMISCKLPAGPLGAAVAVVTDTATDSTDSLAGAFTYIDDTQAVTKTSSYRTDVTRIPEFRGVLTRRPTWR